MVTPSTDNAGLLCPKKPHRHEIKKIVTTDPSGKFDVFTACPPLPAGSRRIRRNGGYFSTFGKSNAAPVREI